MEASSTFFGSGREELNQSQMIQKLHHQQPLSQMEPPPPTASAPPPKKKRNQPGNPNPDAEVIALSPKTLMATNRFICEVCGKGFQREQNLQLHRRGHNLPWKLKQKTNKEVSRKKVYLCPEPSCVHHEPSRALGDLTGIKKHFYRKHGEKKWKCEKCSKKYAVQSDWKAHSKTCGTREYRCDCGTVFSRRDSFVTHRAFCDTLAQETAARSRTCLNTNLYGGNLTAFSSQLNPPHISSLQGLTHPSTNILQLGASAFKFDYLNPSSVQPIQPSTFSLPNNNNNNNNNNDGSQQSVLPNKPLQALMQLPDLHGNPNHSSSSSSSLFNLGVFSSEASNSGMNTIDTAASSSGFLNPANYNGASSLSSLYPIQPAENMSPHMSATALLQKAAQVGATTSTSCNNTVSTLLKGLAGAPSAEATKVFDQTLSSQMQNEAEGLKGFMNSLASFVGGSGHDGGAFGGFGGSNVNKGKLPESLTPNIGGSDKLTLDFLGVGGMVRNMGEILEHEVRSAEGSQWFGNNKFLGDM